VPVVTIGGVVTDPTIAGTCMRRPALTSRTSTLPVTPVVATVGNNERVELVLSNATPLMR